MYFLGHMKRCQESTLIFKHDIINYPYSKPILQHLRVVNPRKAPTIKVEVEKFLNVAFI
jgi:hypothetical protein